MILEMALQIKWLIQWAYMQSTKSNNYCFEFVCYYYYHYYYHHYCYDQYFSFANNSPLSCVRVFIRSSSPYCLSLSRLSAIEFIQYLFPVGAGPSSNTCPKCAPHLVHLTSFLIIP